MGAVPGNWLSDRFNNLMLFLPFIVLTLPLGTMRDRSNSIARLCVTVSSSAGSSTGAAATAFKPVLVISPRKVVGAVVSCICCVANIVVFCSAR